MFNYLEEAKRLQKKYKEQELKYGKLGCYCDQNSASECPNHIADYIRAMELYSSGSNAANGLDCNRKG